MLPTGLELDQSIRDVLREIDGPDGLLGLRQRFSSSTDGALDRSLPSSQVHIPPFDRALRLGDSRSAPETTASCNSGIERRNPVSTGPDARWSREATPPAP